MAEFDGKVAFITGTSGIARATLLRLAGAGASVLACGIDDTANAELEQIIAAGGVRAVVVRADVAVPDSVAAAVQNAVASFGGLDIIVNAAAINPFGTVEQTDPAGWTRAMAVNVGSIYLTGQYGVAAYAATKGAVLALTRAMALDHAGEGIRVNSVSPGSIRTPMLAVAARQSDGQNADIEAVFRRFGAAHPLGRIGEPEEVAEMIAFLAGPRAGFCTGGDYRVDGGLTAGLGVR